MREVREEVREEDSVRVIDRENVHTIVHIVLLSIYYYFLKALCPLQPKKGLVSSVYSSVASMVWQDGGTPSLFNVIVSGLMS